MCSNVKADILHGLWSKFMNSSYKNKSENLINFLKALYFKSIEDRNSLGTIFMASDVSGVAIILTKQFITDLENLYKFRHDSNNESENLKTYLKSENGILILHGLEFIIDQIIIGNQNNTLNLKSSVLKIILESELGNILATTLLSILTDLCLNSSQIVVQTIPDSVIFPEFTFNHYLRQELNLPKKKKKSISRRSNTDQISTDEDQKTVPNAKPDKPSSVRKKNSNIFPKYFRQKNKILPAKYGDLRREPELEIGVLCQSDMEDGGVDTMKGANSESISHVHIITSLRVVARILHRIIPLDPALHTDAITIYLEVLKSCCLLLDCLDSAGYPLVPDLLKLAEDLINNIAITAKILILQNSDSSMTVLLGHKVVDRLLQMCQSVRTSPHCQTLVCDINKLVFYIFIAVSKQTVLQYSGSCRGITHLLTCWYLTSGGPITQAVLNRETDRTDFLGLFRNSRISLAAEIHILLSILRDIPDEKRKVSHAQYKRSACTHHSSQFNYIPSSQKGDPSSDICGYASICQLLLDNLIYLLNSDSKSKSIPSRRKYLLHHILESIRNVSFCCTTNLVGYSEQLVTFLLNSVAMPLVVKYIVVNFLQLIINRSFELYQERLCCECEYTSRHDIVSILCHIRDVCLPEPATNMRPESPCPGTAIVDLLHFIDWLAKFKEDSMKLLVIQHISKPIFNRLLACTLGECDSYYEMIGCSVFAILPYLNSQWHIDDLQLSWSVVQKFPNLKKNFYKCLTIVLLSSRAQTSGLHETSLKTRIIDLLISTVYFEDLMKRLDESSFSEQQPVNLYIDDIYIWQCFRILFTYNDAFRRKIFENNGVDCCYIMLKQTIEDISQIKEIHSAQVKQFTFHLFESLMCLVIDGNMLKNIYFYEGYSYDIIWTQLQSVILKFFPSNEAVAGQLIQSLLNCCFRHKWTVQNALYELKKLFLDSIIAASNDDATVNDDISDLESDSNSDSILQDNEIHDYVENGYDGDMSADYLDFEYEIKTSMKHDLLETTSERANFFIDLKISPFNKGFIEVNTDFLRLFIKIVLSLPIDSYHIIAQKALDSVYNSLMFVPEENQRSFISDSFMDQMMQSIEYILTSQDIPGLQLTLLKLLTLPYSDWCTPFKLKFLIESSQKNPWLGEEILKMLIEKTQMIQFFQPEHSLSLPVVQEKSEKSLSPSITSDSLFSEKGDDIFPNFLIKSKLDKCNWKGLDFDPGVEKPGFSVSMWIQMNDKLTYAKKRKNDEPKKMKKKYRKASVPSPSSKFQQVNEFLAHAKSSEGHEEEELIHILSLYSQDRAANIKCQCFQLWCQPSAGTLVVQLYQRIHTVTKSPEFLYQSTRLPSGLKSQLFSIFSQHPNHKPDPIEAFPVHNFNSLGSFRLVGESIVSNFVPLRTWNLLTITVCWKTMELGLVTWLLNSDVVHQSNLYRNPSYARNPSLSLDSFVTLGQVNDAHASPPNETLSLGSLFVFEGAQIECNNDNLLLMFLSPNWTGDSVTLTKSHTENSRKLASVVMRNLIEDQETAERGALLLERSQFLLNSNWAEKVNDLTLKHLSGVFSCACYSNFEMNPYYYGDGKPAPVSSQNSLDRSSQFLKKHVLVKSSLDSAFETLGGMSVLFFWLAKLVEDGDHKPIRWILKLILSLLRKSLSLSYQNLRDNGYAVLFQLFKSFNMSLDLDVLSDLVQHMRYDKSFQSRVAPQETSQLCRDPGIVCEILIQWKIWASSKLWESDSEIPMTESQALVLDRYLLGQVNGLVNEDNFFSIINCGTLSAAGILPSLLTACYEPFEALGRPLPLELFQLLIQIISNVIPTPVDIEIVKKLCNTILQLYPVSMKDNDMDIGQYYCQLQAFRSNAAESETTQKECRELTECAEVARAPDATDAREESRRNQAWNNKSLSMSLRDSKVSEVEKKALQEFYIATLTDTRTVIEENDGTEEIENSTESSSSEADSLPTIMDDSDNNSIEQSFRTILIASNFKEIPVIQRHCETSRVSVIAGLISTLENVIEVKVSDTVLDGFSIDNFCFEFILHLLTHSSPLIRQASLSLFRVYLYRKRSQIQVMNSQPSIINVVAHILHQNPTTKEIVAESVSLVFGQNLLYLVMDVDWKQLHLLEEMCDLVRCNNPPSQGDLSAITPICKLHGIVSSNPVNRPNHLLMDELINVSSNHFGLYYRHSMVLLLSALGNIEHQSMHWTLNVYSFLFTVNLIAHSTLSNIFIQSNPSMLYAAIKSGLLECICNIITRLTKENVAVEDKRFQALLDICMIIAVSLTITSSKSQFLKLLETCDIIFVCGMKSNKRLMKTDNAASNEKLPQRIIAKILSTVIKTICYLNSTDPAFQIHSDDPDIHKLGKSSQFKN